VHLDFGNNISFCEDPMDTLDILLPYIIAAHIKDQAVEPYEDGFTLSEIPFGEGFLPLEKMVATLQKKDPNMPFDLEMMTREPLKVPVFTDKYWATFGDIPGRDLAHILEIVHKNKPKAPGSPCQRHDPGSAGEVRRRQQPQVHRLGAAESPSRVKGRRLQSHVAESGCSRMMWGSQSWLQPLKPACACATTNARTRPSANTPALMK
jgi:hypothetical protein